MKHALKSAKRFAYNEVRKPILDYDRLGEPGFALSIGIISVGRQPILQALGLGEIDVLAVLPDNMVEAAELSTLRSQQVQR